MSVTVSPLDLLLDSENPRFVVLSNREQAAIRKYLLTYEDVCQLATAINDYGSLLPGERIVVLHENGEYIVVEGNRRTCSFQLLLSRELIPDGFGHKIPHATESIRQNCQTIEVDVLPNREAALELMSKRHIEGVKQWKPIAKKQFFAANYFAGQTVRNLSRITGIRESEIKGDIRDYKFFISTYNEYRRRHPDFDRDIIGLKTDPFWRIFKAKFEFPIGTKVSPTDILKISNDDEFNTVSALDNDLFNQIVQLVFRSAIVTETVTTRNVLTDVEGILPLLELATHDPESENGADDEQPPTDTEPPTGTNPLEEDFVGTENENGESGGAATGTDYTARSSDDTGGPPPGGPAPRMFFETISWRGKLDPARQEHQGLLIALDELYRISTVNCGRQKAYKTFPVATGMILRTVYEQALRLRLMQVGLWGNYCSTLRNPALPMLSSMEGFINQGANKPVVFPDPNMVNAYDRVIAASHREFLNANIHYPGNIRVASDSLEGIAAGGMYYLIQEIINLI